MAASMKRRDIIGESEAVTISEAAAKKAEEQGKS
jgi:hypothetical protein